MKKFLHKLAGHSWKHNLTSVQGYEEKSIWQYVYSCRWCDAIKIEKLMNKSTSGVLNTIDQSPVKEDSKVFLLSHPTIQRFIDSTPSWYENLQPMVKKAPQCAVCGIIPDNMKALREDLKQLIDIL